MTDNNNADVKSEEEEGPLTPNNGSSIDEAEKDVRKGTEGMSSSDAGSNDVPKISSQTQKFVILSLRTDIRHVRI